MGVRRALGRGRNCGSLKAKEDSACGNGGRAFPVEAQAWQRHGSVCHEKLQGIGDGTSRKREKPVMLRMLGGCCTPLLPGALHIQ